MHTEPTNTNERSTKTVLTTAASVDTQIRLKGSHVTSQIKHHHVSEVLLEHLHQVTLKGGDRTGLHGGLKSDSKVEEDTCIESLGISQTDSQ